MIALLAAAVTFAGGNTNDLVHALREATAQDVVVIVRGAPPEKELAKSEFDPTSADSMSSVFRATYDLRMVPGSEPIFSDERIPSAMLGNLESPGLTLNQYNGQSMSGVGNRKPLTGEAFKNGKITFRTEKQETLDMNSNLNSPFPKPVTMSWVYVDSLPYVEAKDATPSSFLQKLARGVGARFRETEKGISLDLQPDEFRRRSVRTLGLIKGSSNPQGQLIATKAKLAASIMQSLNSQQITEAFATPSSRVTVPITRNGSLGSPATAYLMALENATPQQLVADQTGGPPQGRGQRRQPNPTRQITMALRMADPRRNATVTMTAQFQVEVEIPIVDNRGNSAGTVRF